MPPKIHVVAGILFNERGEFLLSSRPEGKPYAGYWEFAGGKVAFIAQLLSYPRFFQTIASQNHNGTSRVYGYATHRLAMLNKWRLNRFTHYALVFCEPFSKQSFVNQ